MRIAITTATDRGYLPAACCQLKSVLDHLSDAHEAELFVVCCDVSDQDVRDAEAFFAARGVPATVIVPDFVDETVHVINDKWPRAAYLRLYFDSIFGAEYDRLVYFDADTRVRADLDPLLTTDLQGRPAGAVHDFIYYVTGNIRRRRRDLMLADDAPYLQSGVMVFDWPALLDDGALERARQFLIDHPEGCQEAPDQDALNAALEGKWTPLDPRWNLHETYLNFGGALTPFLEHYTSTKPWSKRRPPRWREAAEWYRRELSGTPWAGFIPDQTPLDALKSRADFFRFRYAPKVRRGLADYAPVVLDAMKVPRQLSDDRELPWAPKNRKDVEDMAQALVAEASRACGLIRPPESVLEGYKTGRVIGIS